MGSRGAWAPLSPGLSPGTQRNAGVAERGFPGLCLSSKGHGREFSNPEGDLGCLPPGARAASLQGRAWP